MGDNSEKKNFFYEESIYMKFQDSSLSGLEVTVGTKKCDPRTHAGMLQKQYPPSTLSKLGT